MTTPMDPEAAAWYAGLIPDEQRQVDEYVKALWLHPRMQGKSFGPGSALELIYRLHVWARTLPLVALEGRAK